MICLLATPVALQAPAPVPTGSPAPRAVARNVAKHDTLFAAGHAPRDFRGFVEQRRERLAESAVAYEVSQALEECYAVSMALAPASPFVPASSLRRWAELAASETLAAPCRGFEGRRIDPGEVLALLRYSAERGEPRARARLLLLRDVAAPKDDVLRELPAMLAVLDAGIVRDVGAFLVRGETEVSLGGREVPAGVAVIAWELAACDLGYACAAGSRITLAQCAFGGHCGGGGYEEALAGSEALDEMAHARILRTGIVRALVAQDWRWLGLMP